VARRGESLPGKSQRAKYIDELFIQENLFLPERRIINHVKLCATASFQDDLDWVVVLDYLLLLKRQREVIDENSGFYDGENESLSEFLYVAIAV
jgi:hypothetical protein